MSLLTQLHHLLEMLVVDMCIHSEQSFQYCFGNGEKVFGEWHSYKTTNKQLQNIYSFLGKQKFNIITLKMSSPSHYSACSFPFTDTCHKLEKELDGIILNAQAGQTCKMVLKYEQITEL